MIAGTTSPSSFASSSTSTASPLSPSSPSKSPSASGEARGGLAGRPCIALLLQRQNAVVSPMNLRIRTHLCVRKSLSHTPQQQADTLELKAFTLHCTVLSSDRRVYISLAFCSSPPTLFLPPLPPPSLSPSPSPSSPPTQSVRRRHGSKFAATRIRRRRRKKTSLRSEQFSASLHPPTRSTPRSPTPRRWPRRICSSRKLSEASRCSKATLFAAPFVANWFQWMRASP